MYKINFYYFRLKKNNSNVFQNTEDYNHTKIHNAP